MIKKYDDIIKKFAEEWKKRAQIFEGPKYNFEDNLLNSLHVVGCQMYDKGWNEAMRKAKEGIENENSLEEIEEMEKGTLDEVLQEYHIRDARVTRLEIINDEGRAYVNMDVKDMKLSYQDNSKTLKIFIK